MTARAARTAAAATWTARTAVRGQGDGLAVQRRLPALRPEDQHVPAAIGAARDGARDGPVTVSRGTRTTSVSVTVELEPSAWIIVSEPLLV